jgi:asparagine synthase (glutamine-hydrolysing)
VCGISGILLPTGRTDVRLLAAIDDMSRALAHRGPDGHGAWLDREAGIALGHRRLAIIDLSPTGHQPMASASRELILTYNGEVFNHGELRAELEARGHRFVGRSDTEVMLAAFEQHGVEQALPRFAGFFALGLWNRRTREL